MDTVKITRLREAIDKAAQSYYRTSHESQLSDAEYDSLIAQLKAIDPDDERLSRVGIPYSADELREKVKHSIPMGSLDNVQEGIDGFAKWHKDIENSQICASLKVDGSSIRLRYKNGLLVEAVTRGNGEYGELITANVASFKNVPINLNESVDIDVRGEAILFTEEYKNIKAKECGCEFDLIEEKSRSNPRNIGNGIIGRDDGTDSDKMRFIAFNLHTSKSFKTDDQKYRYLKSLGFDVVPHMICDSDAQLMEYYNDILNARSDLPYEIDGIVVSINDNAKQEALVTNQRSRLRPKYAKAIKFPHRSGITLIKDVIISVGHTGAIVPTAVLEQVRIGGVNVEHALLNNWDEIARMDLCIGDTVEVVLAGDIIPKIISVAERGVNRTTIVEPTTCPSCGSITTRNIRNKEGAVTYCSNKNCSKVAFQKIKKWIGGSKTGVGILGIGDAILKALWEYKIVKDPADLYTMKVDDIKDLKMNDTGRIGKTRAQQIISNINDSRSISLDVFLGSLGIELLGRRRVKLLQDAAMGQLDCLNDWLDYEKLYCLQIDGLGDAIRESIVNGLRENEELINKMLSNGVIVKERSSEEFMSNEMSNEMFSGKSFCFTGTRECMEDVENKGGLIKSSVAKSKPTPDFLVQKDPLSTSSKSKNAEANGHTKIISIDYLKQCLDGKADLCELING